MRSQCSEKLNKVIDVLNLQGATVYFVGGCVRDQLMGQACVDFDMEIFGIEEEKLVEVLSQFGPVDHFGKQFGIYKLLNIPEADFALPRKEKKTSSGHQGFDVTTNPYLSVKEAAMRRDFTINALYYNTKTNCYEDYYGGLDDLKHRLIRVVNPSTFIEDPLRVLRLAQFISRFELDVDKQTKQLCHQMVLNGDLESLSKERVFNEYNKMLLGKKPSLGISFLYDIDALPEELQILGQIHQREDFHPEGCVLNHVKMVVDHGASVKEKTSYPLGFMWSCLLHDIGKASTTDEFGHAYNHEIVGGDMCDEVLKKFCNHKKLMKYTKQMIYSHMKLGQYARSGVKDKTFLKLLAQLHGKTTLNDLYYLTEADMNIRKVGLEKVQNFLKEKVERLGHTAPAPVVQGNDLIALGYEPGPKIKELLEVAYDMQLGGYQRKGILKTLGKGDVK